MLEKSTSSCARKSLPGLTRQKVNHRQVWSPHRESQQIPTLTSPRSDQTNTSNSRFIQDTIPAQTHPTQGFLCALGWCHRASAAFRSALAPGCRPGGSPHSSPAHSQSFLPFSSATAPCTDISNAAVLSHGVFLPLPVCNLGTAPEQLSAPAAVLGADAGGTRLSLGPAGLSVHGPKLRC